MSFKPLIHRVVIWATSCIATAAIAGVMWIGYQTSNAPQNNVTQSGSSAADLLDLNGDR